MAQYTIEDIEILRQKSGISYEEAVNLLEYHSGSLARALVDLEKNGRMRDAKSSSSRAGQGSKGKSIFTTLYRFRIKVTKDNVIIINLSSLFLIFTCLVAIWVPIVGLILSLVLGYRISFERNSRDFAGDSFDSVVRNASKNVKSTAFNIAKEFGAVGGKPEQEQPQEPRTESPASGTTPVNVQFPEDGRVNVTEDADGYHEADIQ